MTADAALVEVFVGLPILLDRLVKLGRFEAVRLFDPNRDAAELHWLLQGYATEALLALGRVASAAEYALKAAEVWRAVLPGDAPHMGVLGGTCMALDSVRDECFQGTY